MKFLNPQVFYFKVYEDKFVVKNINLNIQHEGLTQVAFRKKDGCIIASGIPEDLANVQNEIDKYGADWRIVSWFDPIQKTIIDEAGFHASVRSGIFLTSPKTFLRAPPILVFHIINKSIFTEHELLLIKYLYNIIQVGHIYIWKGRELSSNELTSPEILKDMLFIKRSFW